MRYKFNFILNLKVIPYFEQLKAFNNFNCDIFILQTSVQCISPGLQNQWLSGKFWRLRLQQWNARLNPPLAHNYDKTVIVMRNLEEPHPIR